MCWQAVLAQGARPSQPGHVHEPPPESAGEETLSELMYCTWAPPQRAGGLSRSEASASCWACCPYWSSILFPSGGNPQLFRNIVERKRMENQEVGGTIKHDWGGLFLTGGGGWTLGVGGWWSRCGEEMSGCRSRSHVLMSRRRSSGPPWSAPRPPGPGRPWSWCLGTRAWRRRSSGRPSWPTKSSGSGSEGKQKDINAVLCLSPCPWT